MDLLDGPDLLVWGALILLCAMLVLLGAAIASDDPVNDDDGQRDQPSGHKKPPNYTQIDPDRFPQG